ncbi:MAG: hypothetical protein KUL86_06720 [Castellaniella sp.]|nr:hypothetical protein [Castellaniella sp.]
METAHDHSDTGAMDTTRTERLLREAQAICRRVTGRDEPSDDLLYAVFRRLDVEDELATDDPGEWPNSASHVVH